MINKIIYYLNCFKDRDFKLAPLIGAYFFKKTNLEIRPSGRIFLIIN